MSQLGTCHQATVSPKKLIPQAKQVCLIPGDNVPGYQTTHTPTEHSALSFSPGQAGADPTYGHVAFVEQVKSDGSILISESNVKCLGVVSYRTFDSKTTKQFTYVIGQLTIFNYDKNGGLKCG